MTNDPLDKFGELISKRIRDQAINDMFNYASGRWKRENPVLSDAFSTDPKFAGLLRNTIAVTVDETIHFMLFAFETSNEFSVNFNGPDGLVSLAKESDGLAGEVYLDVGWFARFSRYPLTESKVLMDDETASAPESKDHRDAD